MKTRILKGMRRTLQRMTLDYEAAMISCLENKVPLTKANIYSAFESLHKPSKPE